MQTAKFVRGAGKQSVFILRVKHGSNPKMAFLMPNHELHPYFQWAVDNDLVEDASEVSRLLSFETCQGLSIIAT